MSLPDSLPRPVPHFIYVYDPLCGWCYGFGTVMDAVWDQYKDSATLEVVAGGMMRGDRVGPVGEVAPYIRQAYLQVEAHTCVRFGEPYLRDLLGEGATVLDSEPACLMQAAVHRLRPDLDLAFASAVQKAVFRDGMAPRDEAGLRQVAVSLGVDAEKLGTVLREDQTHQDMIDMFNRSESLRVSGFPTLLLEVENRRYVLTRGFAGKSALLDFIRQVLREEGLE